MSIFKRGSVYWFHFLFNGEHIQKSTKQGNPRTARQIEAAYRTALAKGEVGITERKKIPAFKAALAGFLSWSEREHRQHPATHRRYQVSAVALRKHFLDVPLDRITPEEVERYKTLRSGQVSPRTRRTVKPATVNRELACLKALFNHVLKGDVPLRNSVSRVKFYEEHNEQTRVLSYDEQEKYLAKATPMLRDVATLMLETGMRPEEVYRIRRENVQLEKGFLVIPYGKTKAARRRVPLTASARRVLGLRMASDEAYLFPCETDSSRPVPKVNNAHDRAVRDSKVAPFRLYDLRHTWATRAAMSGIDLVTLAAMLGHSRIQMVLRYAHPTQQHQHQAMERLEAFVSEQRIAHAERTTPQTSFAIQ
ncbi:tyrosine-type recombinase/integrase [Edaphobacter aggregans]|uniref:tyrosine-type recombinase/integrase n=1 Tax=Edaphobacter aggregans TaxID=570835 RepID=UPI000552729F|nr:site-specific integrase [Edaphobacter aggregans]